MVIREAIVMRAFGRFTYAQVLNLVNCSMLALSISILSAAGVIVGRIVADMHVDAIAYIATQIGATLLLWFVSRKRLRALAEEETSKRTFALAEEAAAEGNGDVLNNALLYEILLSTPLRKAKMVTTYLSDVVLADDPTYGEAMERVEAAPAEIQPTLRRIFSGPPEEAPWW